ncbi:hypothetical protein [Streptomyces sp. SAS_276]|uniref:hypothetical protein n=1 Tax=Streptomyces sp. SAS_276 TaxID=3412745 RepID=UPI00403D2114
MAFIEVQLLVRLGEGTDELDLAAAVGALRGQLLDAGVEQARLQRSDLTVPGLKSGVEVVAGALLVSMVPHVFSTVIAAIQAWSARASGRSVTIVDGDREVSATGLSAEEQQRLLEDFTPRSAAQEPDAGTPDGHA